MRVDMNSDLGESFGAYTLGMDEAVLSHVTSANVACGWHAGDPLIMAKTVALCKAKGVAVGAHPGYPDFMGFGRRNMTVTPAEAKAYMLYQVGALQAFCKEAGVPLQHVKLHGAFYNTACVDPKLATAVWTVLKLWATALPLWLSAAALWFNWRKNEIFRLFRKYLPIAAIRLKVHWYHAVNRGLLSKIRKKHWHVFYKWLKKVPW